MRLIDADWVLGHLKPYEPSDEEWSVTGGTALRLIHNAVDNAPTVDAEVVVEAKWIPGDKMPNYPRIPYRYNRHYCSACEQPAVAYEHDRYDVVEFLTPRCPYCGAYMKNRG